MKLSHCARKQSQCNRGMNVCEKEQRETGRRALTGSCENMFSDDTKKRNRKLWSG